MSLLDTAVTALKELPLSDILREQLALAVAESRQLEKQLAECAMARGKLEAHLEIERANHQETKAKLEQLKVEHAEETRVDHAIEFRRGLRTGNVWVAFCPKCHLPVDESQGLILCPGKCGWQILVGADKLRGWIAALPK